MPTPSTAERQFFWSIPTTELLMQLQAMPGGLSDAEAQARLTQVGPNTSRGRAEVTWPRRLLGQFKSPLVLLLPLVFAMALSFVLGETTDALIVLSVVLRSALPGSMKRSSTLTRSPGMIRKESFHQSLSVPCQQTH